MPFFPQEKKPFYAKLGRRSQCFPVGSLIAGRRELKCHAAWMYVKKPGNCDDHMSPVKTVPEVQRASC